MRRKAPRLNPCQIYGLSRCLLFLRWENLSTVAKLAHLVHQVTRTSPAPLNHCRICTTYTRNQYFLSKSCVPSLYFCKPLICGWRPMATFVFHLQIIIVSEELTYQAGNAMGMCLTLGLNRRHDAARISQTEFSHRSNLFWTVYVIDRKLSSLIGVPPRLHDEDIALSRPDFATDGSVVKNIMVFHVELSSQLGQILTRELLYETVSTGIWTLTRTLVVYGLGLQRRQGTKFVHAIQAMLERLSDMSRLLKDKLRMNLEAYADHQSRAIASLHVLHNLVRLLR